MAGENAYNLSMTPGDNVSIGGSGAAGTNVPSEMDNSLRALASFVPEILRDLGGGTTVGGSANAITITPNGGNISALFDGLPIAGVLTDDNTSTTVTMNAGSVGAEPVKVAINGAETDPAIGDLRAGDRGLFIWRAAWDSSNGAWEFINLSGIYPVLDEDDMSSDSDAHVSTQQAVKAYVDSKEWVESYQTTTSGTSVAVASIPSTVKEIEIFFNQVSVSGTDRLIVQLGDSGGYEATGYVNYTGQILNAGATTVASYTNGFNIEMGADGRVAAGRMTIKKVTGNSWVMDFTVGNNSSHISLGGGSKTLSGVLDRIRLATSASDTFDFGGILVRYR